MYCERKEQKLCRVEPNDYLSILRFRDKYMKI